MSLLKTNNTKFNVPYIFIVGVFFLVFLVFFARYIEGYGETSDNDFVTENAVISVKIVDEKTIYLEDVEIGLRGLTEKFVNLKEDQSIKVQIQTYDFTSIVTLEIIKMLQKKNYQVALEAVSK